MKYSLVALGLLAQGLAAQSSQPAAVARSLIAEISGDTVLVGALPAKLQGKVYLPATSRVIGSVGRTGLIVSSLDATRALTELEREMPRLGWKLLLHSRPDWGFVFADDSRIQHGLMFCGNGTWLIVTVAQSSEPGTRLRLTADPLAGDCDGIVSVEQGNWRAPPQYDPIPLRLLNPVGARPHAYDVCRYTANPNVGQLVMETGLSADSLMAHYARQLADSSWKPTQSTGMSRSWTRPDSAGRPVHLDLRINGRPDQPRCFELFYQIRPVKP
jgi:hypothetical protein